MGIFSLLYDLCVIRNYQDTLMRLAILTSIVASTILVSGQERSAASMIGSSSVEQLPFCGEKLDRTIGRRFLYITTLDGTLSALDMTKGGKVRWSVQTGPGPLISSSIHRLELTNNGQFVRMIPSLSGGIYKFDGETIDPIPISTENLLSSSYKFSDDLVISGGKETRSYGVSIRTGQLLYECSMNGCINSTDSEAMKGEDDHDPLLDSVMVVRRQTQTVRAVESRTGVERWNFSVGQHQLDMVKSAECHDRPLSDLDMAVLDLDIKVVVPEGIVCVFSKSNPANLLWKHQFDHPIVSGWKIGSNGMLESIDFFATAQWTWDNDDMRFIPPPSMAPSIYLGMYRKQLYIQESISLRKEIIDKTNFYNHLMSTESKLPKIPWKPIAAASNSLVVFDNNIIRPNNEVSLSVPTTGHELVPYDEENHAVSALSVLYASEYVNGNGFYLFLSNELDEVSTSTCDKNVSDNRAGANSTTTSETADEFGFSFDEVDAPVKVVILSLWFWWKEITLIAFGTAVLMNFLLGNRNREIVVIERHIPVPTAIEATETSVVSTSSISKNRSFSESSVHSGDHFTSRFQENFNLERCLGRGGFGLVFEAKHKLDDRSYAVKRITLPDKEQSKNKVMREVKTLANCEHNNIVRYYQSWIETPPPGWQEEEDNKFLSDEMSATQHESTVSYDNNFTSNREKNSRLDPWSINIPCCSFSTREQNGNGNGNVYDDSWNDDTSLSKTVPDIDIQFIDDRAISLKRNIDCSNLSDSFQIEFVQSARNSIDGDDNDAIEENSKALLPVRNGQRPPLKAQTKVFLYIQMELCKKESLRDWLRENTVEQRPNIIIIFEQIVEAVSYVHLKGLIHRDLKPSNIFFSQDGNIKIGDFGLVTDMSDIPNLITKCGDATGLPQCASHTAQVGTNLYMSQEQLLGKAYDYKVDIYSLGLILFELLVYFGTEMERLVTLRDLRERKFPKNFPAEFPTEYELLKLMLSPNPVERPSTEDLKVQLSEMTWHCGKRVNAS